MCSVFLSLLHILLCTTVFLVGAGSAGYGQAMTGEKEMEEYNSGMLDYYRQPGIMTGPGEYAHLLEDLPNEIPDLCKIVQGSILHIFWAEAYGVELSEDRKQEVNLRKFDTMLARIAELSDQPLTVVRKPEMRVVGNCRDFSVFLCALLRHKGIPARARCGFATYFTPNRYEDHWICEYWKDKDNRWVRVDAQLDSLQVEYLKLDFNPCDLPVGKFLSGGEVWQQCRSGELDPDLCGIFDMKGLWFVQGDLVRDFMACNKLEVLPWDCNDLMGGQEVEVSPDDYQLLDRIAELLCGGDRAFQDIRSLYGSNDRLRMPGAWRP
jgi:hypothetical protein